MQERKKAGKNSERNSYLAIVPVRSIALPYRKLCMYRILCDKGRRFCYFRHPIRTYMKLTSLENSKVTRKSRQRREIAYHLVEASRAQRGGRIDLSTSAA